MAISVKIIHKTYRFALLPTKGQEVLLNKHFGCVRYVYNHFLSERITQYTETGKSDHYHEQAACLQAGLLHLDMALKNFFRGKAQRSCFLYSIRSQGNNP